MVRVLLCVVTVGLALAACGGHDKAGGDAAAGAATIRIALRDGSPLTLEPYAAAVKRLAGAGTRVTLRARYRSQDGDPEGATLADVRSGKVPFALIYARVFDDLGVDAFAPLLAPLAIDSLATQQRVIEAGIADRALPALGKLGVVGVAVVPGTLRHPLGLTRPLLRPADFRAAYIGVRRSALAKRSFESLGATVGWELGDRPLSFDGIETDLEGSSRHGSTSARPRSPPTSRCGRASASWWRTRRRGSAERAPAEGDARGGARLPAAAIGTLQRDEDESYSVLCRRGRDVVHPSDGRRRRSAARGLRAGHRAASTRP